jgi:hypothetical protein
MKIPSFFRHNYSAQLKIVFPEGLIGIPDHKTVDPRQINPGMTDIFLNGADYVE